MSSVSPGVSCFFLQTTIPFVALAGCILIRHMCDTSSVTCTFDLPQAISYMCSIGIDTLSPRDFKILRLSCIWVTVLTFRGHVMSSVTWSFFPRYVVSYRCSIDTNPLSWAVCKILSPKHILTYRVTWRHRSRNHSISLSIGNWPFPIGVTLILTLYL